MTKSLKYVYYRHGGKVYRYPKVSSKDKERTAPAPGRVRPDIANSDILDRL